MNVTYKFEGYVKDTDSAVALPTILKMGYDGLLTLYIDYTDALEDIKVLILEHIPKSFMTDLSNGLQMIKEECKGSQLNITAICTTSDRVIDFKISIYNSGIEDEEDYVYDMDIIFRRKHAIESVEKFYKLKATLQMYDSDAGEEGE